MLKKLVIHKTDHFYIQLLRYLFVGGFAFAADFAVFWFLTTQAEVYYLFANVAAFGIGLMVNYLLSVHWVFLTRKIADRRKEFLLFAAIGVIGLILNQFILWLFTDVFGVYVLYSKLIATAFVFGWNFAARRYFVFFKKEIGE